MKSECLLKQDKIYLSDSLKRFNQLHVFLLEWNIVSTSEIQSDISKGTRERIFVGHLASYFNHFENIG